MFDLKRQHLQKTIWKFSLKKKINTYYFSRENNKIITKDITSLDAGSDEDAISEWGGLSQFSAKATSVISKYFVDEEN